ncbi:type II secretion system minor pseudopilin GspI [Spongiibacter sp. KMU-158]|uniref:Type II secretion system protein I n=1 Tax=Spongiibacter pelagi TaxID=2760804 RepID=A0A927C2Q5_9GAMM|nr:type II secretion system minor pseudopilin GspI [Spongiibacter pelagi]MBD2858551.1 type II secretion system minor pseudopilin GspI [Spongiibacter pelagi]
MFSRSARLSSQQGFTLLEVMVALMIFATAAVALTKSLSESAYSTSALEERQFADLVASNLLVDILREGYGNRSSGEASMAGYNFTWSRQISDTPHPNIQRVDLLVQLAENGDRLASRTAYLER